jgi:hypothetical protein
MVPNPPKIQFVLHDRVDGVNITPATIGLAQFNEFNHQVAVFLAGSDGLKLDDVQISISDGSYKLTASLTVLLAAAIESDLLKLQRIDSLGEIDPKRAEVVAKWQTRAKSRSELRYVIVPEGLKTKPFEVSNATDYRMGEVVPWVKTEKYLFGTVMDMGGAQKANVHIRLEDSGQILRIGSSQDYLREQQQNRLYRKVLVRVECDQHFRTGELRNPRLLSFEDYEPSYDEAALDRFAEAGRRAWADVPDAAAWVRELREGQ